MSTENASTPFQPYLERPASPAAGDGFRLETDVPISMRDGVRLATDLYLPLTPGPHPVLLERTPYGKHQSVMVRIQAPQYLAARGAHGFSQNPHLVFNCLSNRGEAPRFMDFQGDAAAAQKLICDASEPELLALLGQSTPLD